MSAIRCVPDTSLEIENLAVSNPYPEDEEVVRLSWDVVNNGLLPATDYLMYAKASIDGGSKKMVLNWPRNDPWTVIYPGARFSTFFEWRVPSFEESLTLTMEVTEQNPTTGGTDYETTNSATLTLNRSEHNLMLDLPYGRTAIRYAEKVLLNSADDVSLYRAEEDPLQTDTEYMALLRHYGDAEKLLEDYSATLDHEDPTGGHRYFYVFVPSENQGNILTNLTYTVFNMENDRVMGSTNVEFLDKGESRVIPVLIPIRTSEFGELGMVGVNVKVTDADGTELTSMPASLQLLDNIVIDITADSSNAAKL